MVSHPLAGLIEQALQRAMRDGAFDDLAGAGKPLPRSADPFDALSARMCDEHRVMPPAVALKAEVAASQKRLRALTDPAARKAEMRILADLQMRLAMEIEAQRRFG